MSALRKELFWMVLLCIIPMFSIVSSGENLVKNPGFEIDANDDGLPDNWFCEGAEWYEKPAGSGCSKVALDGMVKHNGKYSVCLFGENNRGLITQNVPVSPEVTYSACHKTILPSTK